MTNRSILRLAAIIIVTLAGISRAAATDYYVGTYGSDGNDGRSTSWAFRTVQRGLNAAVAGDTVYVRGGTYREMIYTNVQGASGRPVTVAAYPGEQPTIKGSQVVSGWQWDHNSIWKITNWWTNSQQVFIDGGSLRQINWPSGYYSGSIYSGGAGSLASMVAGSYFWDGGSGTLYVWLADGGDPRSHQVEISTAHYILMANDANWLTLRGISFRHNNSSAFEQQGSAIMLGGNCRMESCDVEWCDFAGVRLGYQGGGDQIVNCTITHNGGQGINGSNHANFLIQNCELGWNNYRNFSGDWAAAGAKFATNCWGTVRGCNVHDNTGVGLWFDTCRSGNQSVLDGNYAHDNSLVGLMFEVSTNGLLCNNVVTGNRQRGIYVSASETVSVHNNTLVGNSGWAALDIGGMPRTNYALRNIYAYNNIVHGNSATYDIRVLKPNGGDISNIASGYNLFNRASGNLALWYGADSRGGWVSVICATVDAWKAQTPLGGGCVQGDPGFAAASGASYPLQSSSRAVNAGATMSAVKTDYPGTARPQGGAYDLGAYEFIGTPTGIIPAGGSFPAHINFQPGAASGYSGYLIDGGWTFADRGNGWSYGWTADNTANMSDRNAGNSPDQRYDTLAYMQAGGNRSWEIAVPNGTYQVHIVVGDPWNGYDPNNHYRITAEGVMAIDAIPDATHPWFERTLAVTVADGRLTISNGSGAWNNRICYVDISK